MSSPTQRSKALLLEQGYRVEIVEHWNPWARARKDLWGFLDLLAIRDGETLGVQVTSGSNVSARITKITEHENLPLLRKAGWRVVVHGWRKNSAGKYVLREVDLS